MAKFFIRATCFFSKQQGSQLTLHYFLQKKKVTLLQGLGRPKIWLQFSETVHWRKLLSGPMEACS